MLELQHGKIKINDKYQTSIKNVFAGGDAVIQGEDLTVQAIQDGKLSAHNIHEFLSGENNG